MCYKKVWKSWSSSVLYLNDKKAGVRQSKRLIQSLKSVQWQNHNLNNVFLKTVDLPLKTVELLRLVFAKDHYYSSQWIPEDSAHSLIMTYKIKLQAVLLTSVITYLGYS